MAVRFTFSSNKLGAFMIKDFLSCYIKNTPEQVEKRILYLVRHVWENVPFYREKMEREGLSPDDFISIEDFINKFPKTSSAEYRTYQQTVTSTGLIDKRKRLEDLIEDRSSGSSGVTISVFRSPGEYKKNKARALWYLIRAGVRPWHRILAVLPPSQMVERDSILQNLGIFRRFTVNYTMPVETIVDLIRRKRINVIYGQKSFIRLIADYFVEHEIEPPRLKVLNVGAERVDKFDRKCLAQVFTPIRFSEFYGATEPYLIAAKLEEDGGYEIDYKSVFFSLADKEDNNGLSKGNLLVTSLINEAQPILNLEIGDRLVVSDYDKLLKLEAKIVEVEGRSNDYLYLPEGGRISGATFYASLEYFSFMRQFKIIQEREGECRIMLRITDESNENKVKIEDVLKSLLGGKIRYSVEYVAEIPMDSNGKTKILSSSIGNKGLSTSQ